jgi:hypothetical protein
MREDKWIDRKIEVEKPIGALLQFWSRMPKLMAQITFAELNELHVL